MDKIFERNEQLLGKEVISKIEKSNIIVCGVGGVGGYALESFVRLGFINITIVDFDIIEESNINRQLISNSTNIGNKKTTEFSDRILKINPNCNVKILDFKISEDNIEKLNLSSFDFVIDCIDDVNAKIALYKYCQENNLNLISSMGAANKIDPSKTKITKLSKTVNDKLAHKMRELCKKEKIDQNKIDVVYSDEDLYNKECKNLPSIILVPASFGLNIAYYVLKKIITEN